MIRFHYSLCSSYAKEKKRLVAGLKQIKLIMNDDILGATDFTVPLMSCQIRNVHLSNWCESRMGDLVGSKLVGVHGGWWRCRCRIMSVFVFVLFFSLKRNEGWVSWHWEIWVCNSCYYRLANVSVKKNIYKKINKKKEEVSLVLKRRTYWMWERESIL